MKNKIKLIIIMALVLLVSGCYKFEGKMNITKDKKMDFELIYAIVDMGEMGQETEETEETNETNETDETDETESNINCDDFRITLGSKGFTITDYKDDSYVGCKITKSYDSIDAITIDTEFVVDLNKYIDGTIDDTKLFQKKGNNYVGNFMLDTSTDEDISTVKDMFKMSYEVKLPYKNISNNATEVSEDGKTLKWTINAGEITNIDYEFNFNEKQNPISLLLIGGVILGVLILSSIIVLIFRKKQSRVDNTIEQNMVSQSNAETPITSTWNISQNDVQTPNDIISNTDTTTSNDIISNTDTTTSNDIISNTDTTTPNDINNNI